MWGGGQFSFSPLVSWAVLEIALVFLSACFGQDREDRQNPWETSLIKKREGRRISDILRRNKVITVYQEPDLRHITCPGSNFLAMNFINSEACMLIYSGILIKKLIGPSSS